MVCRRNTEFAGTTSDQTFWPESFDLAKGKVLERIKKGGHGILPDIIERRYYRGLKNFFQLYRGLSDSWIVYNNSGVEPLPLAKGNANAVSYVYNNDIWKLVQPRK